MNYAKEIKKLKERIEKLEASGVNEPTEKVREKITLKEFFESKADLVIHCDAEEKANRLLQEFDKLGKKWCDGDSYLGQNHWRSYTTETCYSNVKGYCDIEWYRQMGYKVYEFEDVIFENSDKITLKEFFDSEERLAIHCNTEEKANKLLQEFDKMGETWGLGVSYLNHNNWEEYKTDTCYSNVNGYGDVLLCTQMGCKIYEFEDIIFEEKSKDKITAKEFFRSNNYMAIHCKSEEQANRLLREFNSVGAIWASGDSYLDYNNWKTFKENTCYLNVGLCEDYAEVETYLDVKIYDFEDVIFENEIFTEFEKAILRNLPLKWKWIARDEYGFIKIYEDKPKSKLNTFWICDGEWFNFSVFKHLFQSIQWEDDEPCEFRKYLGDKENE